MSRIFLTGDIHNYMDIRCLNSKYFPEQKQLSKDDYLIVLGDFGLPWDINISDTDKHWLDWLKDRNFTTLFVDGNHENFDYLNKCPTDLKFGSEVGKVWDSVYHLKRGNVYTINDKTFFVMGGAVSIDKLNRTEGLSWWKDETPSHKEFEHSLKTLDSYGWGVDYVLTHTAPKSIIIEYMTSLSNIDDEYFQLKKDIVSDYLDAIMYTNDETLKFKKHFFAHFHDNYTSSCGKHELLYRKVVELC
jgi:hypothetical protein